MAESTQQHLPDRAQPDQIRADRACIGCGFNLYGQTVTREEHYGLAIARCPECGTVAALQQYPLMSHWVNRFRAILAGLYLMLLLGTLALSTMIVSGFAFALTEMASQPLGDFIGIQYTQWQQSQAEQNGNPVQTYTVGRWMTLTPDWIDEHLDGAIDSYGSLWGQINPDAFLLLLPAGLVSVLVGMYWSVALLGATWRRAFLIPMVGALIGAVFVIGANIDPGTYPQASDQAMRLYLPRIVSAVMLYQIAMMGLGVFIGRPVARFAVCMALPPRSRVPLGVLWTRDGLPLPKP
ncbi:MAG: hypothetical protein CMJ35_04540 [Phycisphaerae bacterium]|nr:hypothetical protein [Phycisphaerae bacterium]MBM90867.1 hypothetical protein [Phycisphaerae bacterium]HCT46619.1 hypothetical protein [Phycisphaerales bacterium]|tara:strand:- start:1347 stop:2228 length:882 start_codon:yes stop_codon:yes gene_type:complete